MTGTTKEESTLARLRGTLGKGRANARSVAALTDNPGCTRRRVLDAASIKSYQLAEQLSSELDSPGGIRMVRSGSSSNFLPIIFADSSVGSTETEWSGPDFMNVIVDDSCSVVLN